MRSDTIAAIATAPGEGAIGIVRLSGPDARSVGLAVFSGRLRDRRAVYGRVIESDTGHTIEHGIATLMCGPRSYTGEDTLELSVHGGVRSTARVLEAVLRAGARPAQPGEFTLRAFLSGRIDLTQAEAVLDLVGARTDDGVDLALAGLEGRLAGPIREARFLALETLAYLGARADFPDDDVPMQDIGPELDRVATFLESLVAGADYGVLQRDGARIAILGPPNAGKSSLLNRLLRQDRAIVTPLPGTTRDTIEETANLCGLPVVLTDTAGLRDTDDPAERMGVQRSHAVAAASAVVLLVIDGSLPISNADRDLVEHFKSDRLVVALNKRDLPLRVTPTTLAVDLNRVVAVSALTGENLDRLERNLYDAALRGARRPVEGAALSTIRQREAARRALDHVHAARDGYRDGIAEDLLSVDLSAAVRALGELTGDDATEDLLDTIFSRFCIGK